MTNPARPDSGLADVYLVEIYQAQSKMRPGSRKLQLECVYGAYWEHDTAKRNIQAYMHKLDQGDIHWEKYVSSPTDMFTWGYAQHHQGEIETPIRVRKMLVM